MERRGEKYTNENQRNATRIGRIAWVSCKRRAVVARLALHALESYGAPRRLCFKGP